MLETYGELIFTYSHNVQVRKGDPVRLLDFEAYEAPGWAPVWRMWKSQASWA